MKIEIDFGRPESLKKMKRELEMALSTIETALIAINKEESSPQQLQLPKSVRTPELNQSQPVETAVDIALSGLSISSALAKLPNEFSMTDLFSYPDCASIPRSRVRKDVNEAVEGGWLTLTEAGQGRRPSKFRKT